MPFGTGGAPFADALWGAFTFSAPFGGAALDGAALDGAALGGAALGGALGAGAVALTGAAVGAGGALWLQAKSNALARPMER
jgi:uncharacterized protein YjbI with pentapeptide repeats